MPKSVEFQQLVTRAIDHDSWKIPRIRNGDRWRVIENSHLIENPHRINGHDRYEDAIHRTKEIMKRLGWHTRISETQVQCDEHLYFQQFQLRCWKVV